LTVVWVILVMVVVTHMGLGAGQMMDHTLGSCVRFCSCEPHSVRCASQGLDTIPMDLDLAITSLELPHNNIKYVGNMEAYTRLETLDLSYNSINDIKLHCFRYSSSIAVLSFRSNSLGSLDETDLTGLSGLVDLDLSQNSISQISDRAFQHQTNLQTLNLTNNRVISLDTGIFTTVQRTLRNLYLAHNLLSRVPREVLTGLQVLDKLVLSNNNIRKVNSGEFSGLRGRLSELRLENCGLSEVGPVAFQGISSLRLLDLRNNLLDKVPNRAFTNLPLLETLFIGRNRIRTLGRGDLLSLKQLKQLHLDGCDNVDKFTLEPGVFGANTDLIYISVKCPVLEISPEVSLTHLSQLSSLTLSSCGLSFLPEYLVTYLSLDLLDISSNPLVCDCRLRFLLDVLRSRPELDLSGSCSLPEQFHGKQIKDLLRHEKDFVCDFSKISWAAVIALVGGLLIGVLALVSGIYLWRSKRPWSRTLCINKNGRKRPPNFSGSKKDIKVIQTEVADHETPASMIPLKSGNLDPVYDTEPVYETIPPYNIPVTNFPDVKVSML